MGGTSIFGSAGRSVHLGFLLIGLLKNGRALTGIKGSATIVVIGLVLILAILASHLVECYRH